MLYSVIIAADLFEISLMSSVTSLSDITIFDPNEEYVYTKDKIVSKAKNSPFINRKLKGKVKYTIVSGDIVYKDVR